MHVKIQEITGVCLPVIPKVMLLPDFESEHINEKIGASKTLLAYPLTAATLLIAKKMQVFCGSRD